MAEKSLGLVKLEALLLLPVYGIYEGMDCLAGGKRPAKEHVTEEDILHLVNAGNENGVIEEQQREMINNIFEFDDIPYFRCHDAPERTGGSGRGTGNL